MKRIRLSATMFAVVVVIGFQLVPVQRAIAGGVAGDGCELIGLPGATSTQTCTFVAGSPVAGVYTALTPPNNAWSISGPGVNYSGGGPNQGSIQTNTIPVAPGATYTATLHGQGHLIAETGPVGYSPVGSSVAPPAAVGGVLTVDLDDLIRGITNADGNGVPQPYVKKCTVSSTTSEYYYKPPGYGNIQEDGTMRATSDCPSSDVTLITVLVNIEHHCAGAEHDTSNTGSGSGYGPVYTDAYQTVNWANPFTPEWCMQGTSIEWNWRLHAEASWGQTAEACAHASVVIPNWPPSYSVVPC